MATEDVTVELGIQSPSTGARLGQESEGGAWEGASESRVGQVPWCKRWVGGLVLCMDSAGREPEARVISGGSQAWPEACMPSLETWVRYEASLDGCPGCT